MSRTEVFPWVSEPPGSADFISPNPGHLYSVHR